MNVPFKGKNQEILQLYGFTLMKPYKFHKNPFIDKASGTKWSCNEL